MDPDLMVSCPYNPAHRIRKYKLMSHIVKCKKSSKTENKTECPLDKSHIVDCDHIREHVASCSSLGKLVDTDTAHSKSEVDIMPAIVDTYRATENWEEEPEVPPYNPMEVSAKKQVIRCIPGLSKSNKKKFKESERMRIADLKGINISRTDSSIVKNDMTHEVPLRPPRSAVLYNTHNSHNTGIAGDDSHVHDHDASVQDKPTHKFQHNSFHRILYDELAPECDDINQQLEHSLYGFDMGTSSARDCSQHDISRETGSLPISDQNQETKAKKIEIDETCEIFGNLKKGKSDNIPNTSSTPERVTDKLLALLKGDSDVRKIEPVEEIKEIDQNDKEPFRRGFMWEEFNKFNDRLAYLTDIQNAAAEESALLLKQLNKLKLCRDVALRK